MPELPTIIKVFEIKRCIALAKVEMSDGKRKFVHPMDIPFDMRVAYYEERRAESIDGQS